MKVCKYCDSACSDEVLACPACGGNEFAKKCANCGNVFDTGAFCPMCGVKVGAKPKKCPKCGKEYFSAACPDCGYVPGSSGRNDSSASDSPFRTVPPTQSYTVRNTEAYRPVPSGKQCSKWVAFFLCLIVGYLGVHKFYEGKNGLGILYLFTMGLFGIGMIIDLLVILGKPDPYYV